MNLSISMGNINSLFSWLETFITKVSLKMSQFNLQEVKMAENKN